MNINKVSQSVRANTPDFFGSEYPLFNKFIEYYYRSQEKTGLGQNIVNNFLQYLDIDKLDIGILDGATKVVESVTPTDDVIVVESVDQFLQENGSVLIGDEVIYYESVTSAPNIALSPGISYEQVRVKWRTLSNLIDSYDGTSNTFPLVSQDIPISVPSPQHLVVQNYGQVLIPNVDYVINGTNIQFTTPPRQRIPADDNSATYIYYLSGFIENPIIALDNISNSFGNDVKSFKMTLNGQKYEPIVDEYVVAIYDNRLLTPKVDFFIDNDTFIFKTAPLNGRILSMHSIEAPIPSFGSGAKGFSRVNASGEITDVLINDTGSGYRFDYPPKVTISSETGKNASVSSLVDGVKTVQLLTGGKGYSSTNPPIAQIEQPTKLGSKIATLKTTVTDGAVDTLTIENSGSGYTFTPRVTFRQPGGAKLAAPTVTNGQITGTIEITDTGFGYSTTPLVYIDEPTGLNGIKAAFSTTISADGELTSVNILNAGQGYESVPKLKIIDPVGAQILDVRVDGDGRVIGIDLLAGGSGYEDIPSIYIVDDRVDTRGVYIGGSGATAVASIFNGRITDINIDKFGTGYSADNPPTVIIQNPPSAKASVEIGLNEITGFDVNQSGSAYTKASLVGCARASSGVTSYTESGNAVFSNNTIASSFSADAEVKCLDALFIKRLLDKYTEQFLPDVPSLDYKSIDVRTSIKTIKDFYSAKGTSFSIAYLFKLLYGETVSISYPKDQIIKPSAATWSVDTILRATLVSGDPTNIKDGLLTQEADIADPNIKDASALVENYISIKTSDVEIFELVLSEETIDGEFVVPYKTKLAEPLSTTDSIITVDSTIGWPERNGKFIIGGTELIEYKEKSLNQFIECTRSANGIVEDWDSATEVTSNFRVYLNRGSVQEVVMDIVGIVDAQQTTLTDTGSYYLPGDKLNISKLGGTSNIPELNTWLYNVKKLIEVSSITFGGVNDQSATVTCSNPHGLLVGDQVTVYGANPIIYNGSFLVTSRDSETVFQYQLPQPGLVVPQGNILVSIDLNKGKSDNSAVFNAIGPYTTNVQNSFFNDSYVYVASTGIPNYKIGPFPGSALLPGNQRKLNRFPLVSTTISNKNLISPGAIGTWINGVSIWSYKSPVTKTFGAITGITITNPGESYDAAFPPSISITGGGGTGASASVTVNGSINEITVLAGGSGYTSSPLVSIVGGGGSGAAATAIITKGVVSRILIVDGGTGYTSQPSISIVGGEGTGATGSASVRGPIKTISVDTGGESYTSEPSISLSSGTGAVAQAIVSDGRIISIAIISAGQGYTTPPIVTIQGDGFGAIARASIDRTGENAGRVTSIEIINRGIGYTQGQTIINMDSVGQGATFSANVFEWTYNLQETSTFDSADGSVFIGYNNQYGGEYAHLSNPQRLRYILGDNLTEVNDVVSEIDDSLEHSPIIGWAFDGNPIYGPYGYTDPTDQTSNVLRLQSSYQLKSNLIYDAVTNPYPSRTAGPLLTNEVAGNFIEDYEYIFSLGDLDQYNGRFCKTPQYPEGRYCYFVTIDNTTAGSPIFPYVLGPSFNSVVDDWNLSSTAIQQNIPTGVVRFRDPYENVDIDVDRAPNASTNSLSLENGDFLLFEVEDENRDGIISQDELDDPDQVFEESPLQLFDYFPTVRFDSKVDIEVETTTKFEDASVTGFTIENSGQNYQVDDRLLFENENTGGTGVSARISRIKGEDITSYNFETLSGSNFGVLTTTEPHNIIAGDTVFVDYTPVMNNTSKQFVVRQYKGIEQINILQTGSGYNEDIPPVITIDGDGESGELSATVTSVGSIDNVSIVNSGSGYTTNPRVILSHPQIFKKADYYVSLISNNDYVKVNDVFLNDKKESFICGKTKDSNGNVVAFVAKLSATGVKEWEKNLELPSVQNYAEFERIFVDGNDIWVVGNNRPNSVILDAYNPDIILAKYTQADNGLSATLTFQKAYAGISGATREDVITSIKKMSDTEFIIGGYTNTNSANPYDAFVASINTDGSFSVKRKLASINKSEKLTDLLVVGTDVYFTMETSATVSSDDVKVSIGKVSIGTSVIQIDWITEISNSLYSFFDSSIVIDEFDELYVPCSLRLKTDNETKNVFWVGKFNTSGTQLWNYAYSAPGRDIELASNSSIDIFGDLNLAYTRTDNITDLKTVATVKIDYTGKILNHTINEFDDDNIEGITVHSLDTDSSGDVHVFGQTSWNRNEFIFEFSETDTATDKTGHYTPTLIGNDATDSLTLAGDGYAKLFGKDIASPSNWENAAIKFAAADLGTKLNGDWTIEFMLYKDATNSDTHSQTQQTLLAIGDATDATGGLWLYYDVSNGQLELVVTNNATTINSTGSGLTSTQTTMYADNSWQFVGLKKSGDAFTAYVNGIQIFTGTVANTSLGSKDLHFGNIPGKNGTTAAFVSNYQGQYYIDNLRLRNRSVTPTVPTDVVTIPPTSSFALAFDWADDAWFTTNMNQYDYIDYVGFGLKVDKNADVARLGDQNLQTNTGISLVRTAVTPVTGATLVLSTGEFVLAGAGFQSLDFDSAVTTMTQDTETLTYSNDVWSSRTATIPSPGSQKLKVEAVVKDRYYFKVTPTLKIDNIQELTINQSFRFTTSTKLVLNDAAGAFVNSGYIVKVDSVNNKVYLAVNNNSWSDDLNTGNLITEQFNEQSSFGIVGPIPNDVNEISSFNFIQVNNQTPGTFVVDLANYDSPTGGSNNLDEFAKFKPYTDDDYNVRIDEVSGSSPFVVGSVVTIDSGDISFNTAYSEATVTNLTGVLKITLIANLAKRLQVTAVSNSDEVYVITQTAHYLSSGEMLYVDGNPSETVNSVVYDEYDGSFAVDTVVSPLEFTYKLPSVAVTSPATSAGSVNIFIKSPVLKMYYGHQYVFNLGHSTMVGGNLSFSKDNLYKLEYSFNSIERVGTPGVTGEGQPIPTVKLKVDKNIVTNISYYFDPSRPDDDTSPVIKNSYLDVVDSPYKGTFLVSGVSGGTITRGADVIKFPLINEPEGNAEVSTSSYSTSSKKAVGSISNIRIVNAGGFYQKLPVVSGIQSTRNIERVQINEPGTEYAVGTYNTIPIAGDGEGGLVQITVANGQDAEGVTIPGQIQEVVVTSAGKGYTTASIDVEAIDGILGAGLTGSGAELVVVIPPFGTGASIFTIGTNVGKIKKLKNNNFGYDYPHDYTLRPEITFPLNAQLTSTSILDSITVTDPGSGYSQAPAVVVTGGGGSGAIAEASIKNGRLDQIIVKDPGSGYSSTPVVSLRSSFNYVINLDLGLLQFAFPHGIPNGSQVSLNVVDTGDGADFPLAAGALGRLNATTTYFAITGAANSLEDDQMKLAITSTNAELGDSITFSNAGTGRQQVQTESFGGSATGNVVTSTFLAGELVYQGDTLATAIATGYVSTNSGWQVGPRLLKIVDYTGEFVEGQSITGTISKSSGIISDLKVAKGVLDIGSITKTTGQFIDDVGKPSEIIQKIQDSYYYQDFSYAVKSAVSISEWKDILLKNVHPASFKVFGELNINEYGSIPNKETDFELVKSVELAREAIVPNIQNFALVEPVYSEFNNTEVLFRQKRLTSSENILTSVVQRLDDISSLFDGVKISFPLTVNGQNVVANASQLMIVLNGVVQTPNTAFEIQNDSIVFSEPPSPPASVKYVNVTVDQIDIFELTFTNISGIFPNIGNDLVGTASNARLTVTKVVGNNIFGFVVEGTFIPGELCTVGATGFASNVETITAIDNLGLFTFGETVTNLTGDTARVEQINLETGQESAIAELRYTIGAATASFEVVDRTSYVDAPVASGVFVVNEFYQIGSEIIKVLSITNNSDSTTLGVLRGQQGTQSSAKTQETPIYGTQIEVTGDLTLSKTAGTYQSTPGLFDIQLNDVVIGAASGVVARVTATSIFQDPITLEFISQINISEGSSFFGLLFNRIASNTYPNIVLDDISQSQVNIVEFTDNTTAFNISFPANEPINNFIIPYDNAVGTLQNDEYIRNYKIEYGNSNGDFTASEELKIRKLTFKDRVGTGFFAAGQVIRTQDTKGEVIGYSQASKVVYIGKIGRTLSTGADYHEATFNAGAQLNTYHKKFSTASLALSQGTSTHTFVSGVANSITVTGGGIGPFTAATGTSYDPLTGLMIIQIGTHSLTTSNSVTIADEGVVFTCAQDNNTSNKSYPRSTDPASAQALSITAVTSTTITVNVGAVPIDEYLTIPTSTEFGFGTNALTIECYIKPLNIAGNKTIFDMRTTGTEVSPYLYLDGANLKYYVNGSNVITGTANLVADTWYHVAISRSGSTTKMFIDGVQDGSDYSDGSNYGSTKPLRIGAAFDASNVYTGYIDELRVSDTARYTTAFTPLNGIFQGDSNTKLLMHFDGTYGQTYTEDWSGGESFTNLEDFNNDAILATSRVTGAPAGFAGKTHRYIDAANLIIANKDFVAKETVYLLTQQYPSLVIPGGNVNCEDDIRDILDAIIEDMRNGSNNHMWDASALYVNRNLNPVTLNHVETEITETIWAYNKVNDILQYIINNVLWTVSGNHGLTQKTDTTLTDSSTSSLTQISPTSATYDHTTGNFVLTIGSHSLTTASRIALAGDSIAFTCASDGNQRVLTYPDPDSASYNSVLPVTAVDATTITVNVGIPPTNSTGYSAHTFNGDGSTLTNAITVLDYTTGDCADVYSTIGNLIDILTDTLSEAETPTNTATGDHLATVTKVTPAYEFIGGTVDAYLEVPLDADYHDGTLDTIYTNQIDLDSRYRFYDAANLLRANSPVIVDKAAADMIARYPDLNLDMPRNADGSGAGTLRCKTDLSLILDGIIDDIRDGGNRNTIQAGNFYLGINGELLHIRLQVFQSVYAHERLAYYAKQAITGDLDYTNTDSIITGDWGITNDAGGCQNVKDAIDTLTATLNDIIAPTNADFEIGADRLYFNRQYIAEEITGLTTAEFTYTLDGINYLAFSYPGSNGEETCQRDLKLILLGMISDLQTGGTNSTIAAIKTYLNSDNTLNHIESELLATVYSIEQLAVVGEYALRNYLYEQGANASAPNYNALYTDETGYRDSESVSNIDLVVFRLRDLVNIAVGILAPSGDAGRSAAKNILYNRNYYVNEISQTVNNQFGSGTWTYDDFLNDMVDNVVHDIITTDTSSTSNAYDVFLENIGGSAEFAVAEVVTSSGGGTATILEYSKEDTFMVVGPFTGTAWVPGDTLTGANGGTATIASGLGGSIQFNGTNYTRVASSPDFQFGTNAITIEAWVYRTSTGAFQVTGAVQDNLNLFINNTGIGFYGGSGASFFSRSFTFAQNTWYHVAIVRDDISIGSARAYVDGVQVGQTASWGTDYSSAIDPLVGRNSLTGLTYANGYISNLRIVESALYTANFTPPVSPLTSISNTVLLTCQGSTSDNSPSGHSITEFNSPVSTTVTPFANAGGISNVFTWFNTPTNVKSLGQARTITSNITGQIAGINLLTNPENIALGLNTAQAAGVNADATASPDSTLTADKVYAASSSGEHYRYKNYSLTSYQTFDSSGVKFDNGTETLDTGSPTGDTTQQYTTSIFLKSGEFSRVRWELGLDAGAATRKLAFFDVNLSDGTFSASPFTPQGGITVNDHGIIPYGNGWYRVFITGTFSFGISELRSTLYVRNSSGVASYTGDDVSGVYAWGLKLNKGTLDPYAAVSGEVFYSDTEFNVKTFTLDLLNEFMSNSLNNTLLSPSGTAGFFSFYDATAAAEYSLNSFSALVRNGLNIIDRQLVDDTSYTQLQTVNGITVPSSTYGTRNVPVGISGGIQGSDYLYGTQSDVYGEVESVTLNEGFVVKVYKRFRIDGDITDGPFTMNESVQKQGASGITGTVYGFFEDENFKYIDIEVTAGVWAITDTIVGATNSTTAQISAIEDRIHIIDLKGEFNNDIPFKAFTSGAVATPTSFIKTEAAVTSNAGGRLIVDTESLIGTFESTSVVYPSTSRQYLDVSKFAGLDIGVGDRIASTGYVRLGISILSSLNAFTVGNRLYRVIAGQQDSSTYGIITKVDLDNNFVYVSEYLGNFANGDQVGDYGIASNLPVGYAQVVTRVVDTGSASARIQDIRTVGITQRLYLTDIVGAFEDTDAIKGPDSYESAILSIVDLKARVKRSFKGFDGTQTNFKLSTDNGTQYLPDPEGHMLIFINGVLQPPGATNAFTAFSDEIQFTEAPEFGSSFTGFYVGKLRQLDDISFEFDSLRQSFNLKRNDVFYSLTLTEGVQSSVIRPENNIIVSLNGVVQEPGIGFEIVGSRIIFSEIPRVGSSFVAFSYVGSEADVDAAEVIPPVEPGDLIQIQGETDDREVAVIESSNSLITFDYLGSVFGQGAQGSANLTTGTIDTVSVTAGGSGYTSRPSVRLDSISGFDGQVRALVGVAGVEVTSAGSGYKNPEVIVESIVPDDWTPPNLSDYGEELVDPEIV
jgi:hypothetical protein